MDRITKICDVSGAEVFTLPVTFDGIKERHSKMDAAGDTDEWYENTMVVFDLSHVGAMSIINELKKDCLYKDVIFKMLNNCKAITEKRLATK